MKLTLQQMLAQFRRDAQDTKEPHLWEDEQAIFWLNEAESEAAVRKRLLHESSNPLMCEIQLVPGQATYPLHPAMYELTWLAREEDGAQLDQPSIKSLEWLDRKHPDWRTRCDHILPFVVQNETSLRLATPPRAPGVLRLEGYRLPAKPMKCDRDTPEIHAAHHAKLVLWALFRAFSQPDADGFDPQRAAKAEAEFTAYFGQRPDADLRRDTREDETQVNVSYL